VVAGFLRLDLLEDRMTKILLIRHGHVEGITPEKFRGRVDLPLTARGEAEAAAVASRVAGVWRPRKVYTSPLVRCVRTGQAISEACGCGTEVLADLIDIDYGAWQGKSYEQIRQADPQSFARWFAAPHLVRFPEGEALQDLVARTANALRLVLRAHAGDTVVLVGHDNVNRALLLQLLDQPLSAFWRLEQAPCCVNEIEVSEGRIRVCCVNETSHLRRLGAG
jgi:broad specificity phosphatase PhoE